MDLPKAESVPLTGIPPGTHTKLSPVSRSRRAALDVLYPNSTNGVVDEAEVDIIAVHGLGSDVDWSWTWKDEVKTVNWLKDAGMLPAVVPKSRIMVYNYDSKWHSDAPRTRLQICGEDLMHSLHHFRQGMADRPIIFIGHSLGGNVIQHGLLFAASEPKLKYLPSLTAGFVALGSPFRGSKMQPIADMISWFMGPAGSHRGITKELGYEGAALLDKLHSFNSLLEELPIPVYCFFELYETDFAKRLGIRQLFGIRRLVKGMVVEGASACISGRRHSLQTDHFKMNKFSGPDDRSFMSVSGVIREIYEDRGNTINRLQGQSSEHHSTVPAEQHPNPSGASSEYHFMVPFGRADDFVGRESLVEQLLDRVPPGLNEQRCQRTVIDGLGGVGKTTVALEVVFRIHEIDSKCSIFWVSAVDSASFDQGYRGIGERLGLRGMDEPNKDVKTLVKAALSQERAGKWLLVVDNADDMDLFHDKKTPSSSATSPSLNSYFPFNRKGSILITTRNHKAAVNLAYSEKNIFTVREMSRDESLGLLKTTLKEEQIQNTEATEALLDLLANLPLAIRQASAYMTSEQISTTKYLQLCKSSDKNMIDLLSKGFEAEHRYETIQNPVARTWLISFRHISNSDPLAAEYLRFMCFLAEKNIPESLLPEKLELKMTEAIGTLKAYAFIKKREISGTSTYDMHRLVRLVMLNWLTENGDLEEWTTIVLRRLAVVFPCPTYENRDEWMAYLPHTQYTLQLPSHSDSSEVKPILLCNVGESFHLLGSYEDAERMYQQALELMEATLGKEHHKTIKIKNKLGMMYQAHGKHEEAEQMHRQNFELLKQIFGKEDRYTLRSMHNLAAALRYQGKYKESEYMSQEVLDLSRKVLGEMHYNVFICMSDLAKVFQAQGKYQEAEQMCQQTLELRKQNLGERHPSSLNTMNNLAEVFRDQGKYKEAEQIYQQTIELRKQVQREVHPDIFTSMSSLAGVFRAQEKYQEAEQMYQRTLELRKQNLGERHPSSLNTMNNLAGMFRDQGKYKEAAQLYQQIIKLRKQIQGKEHPETLVTMQNLAYTWKLQNRNSDAIKLLSECCSIEGKTVRHDHPDRILLLETLDRWKATRSEVSS